MRIAGLQTSEQVSYGHPDKAADQVSDALLDAFLQRDPGARVAVETLIKDDTVVLGGEVSLDYPISNASIEALVRVTLEKIYDGVYADSVNLINLIGTQSSEIALGTDDAVGGAGDQGIMVGYAVNNPATNYLPLPYYLACRSLETIRPHVGTYFGSDAKAQVTVYPENDTVNTLLISTQHNEDIELDDVQDLVSQSVIEDDVMGEYLERSEGFRFLVNPTGKFVMGGPWADCGLTGRKTQTDTYGTLVNHGGGAFSGKDMTKVDRSAAYMSRYVAKNLVNEFELPEVTVRVAYAIGIPEPVELSVYYDTAESSVPYSTVYDKVMSYDWTPRGIERLLGLSEFGRSRGFLETASGGHFTDPTYPWEILES